MVTSRCNLSTEGTRSPVEVKSLPPGENCMSVWVAKAPIWLLMNATIIWRCGPMGSVRQTAGRTLLEVKSSKGKGTRTTLPLVMKRLAVASSVDILARVVQKIESGVGGDSFCPFIFRDVSGLRHENDDTNATGPGNRQRFVQSQLMLGIHDSRCFNGIHDEKRCLDARPARAVSLTCSQDFPGEGLARNRALRALSSRTTAGLTGKETCSSAIESHRASINRRRSASGKARNSDMAIMVVK